MQNEINKHFCANTNQSYASSGSLLCDQCNKNQEMKLNEMKKFDEKMDVQSFEFKFFI